MFLFYLLSAVVVIALAYGIWQYNKPTYSDRRSTLVQCCLVALVAFAAACIDYSQEKYPHKWFDPKISDVPHEAHVDTIKSITNNNDTTYRYELHWNDEQ